MLKLTEHQATLSDMFYWIILGCLINLGNCSITGELQEVCLFETFEARCEQGKSVHILEAKLGRMAVGRCISTSYWMGCSVDVRPALEEECAGKSQCDMEVVNLHIREIPCRQDLMSYLGVRYDCVESTAPMIDKGASEEPDTPETVQSAVTEAASVTPEIQEICSTETFEARCEVGERVHILTAMYGRMALGRCMKRNYLIGCATDVSSIFNDLCGNRAVCFLSDPARYLENIHPCPRDLTSYLEISYECIEDTSETVRSVVTEAASVTPEVLEICETEVFDAQCEIGETIQILSAMMGRMRLGRCVKVDFGIECATDVSAPLNTMCSGRRHCRVPFPNVAFEQLQSFPTEIRTYLEISYECVKDTRKKRRHRAYFHRR